MFRKIKTGTVCVVQSLLTKVQEFSDRPLAFEYLFWEVTDACNSRCHNCSIWKHETSKDILTMKEIEGLFASGFFKNVKEVIISGGEPVLLPYLRDALLIMHRYIAPNALVSLSTNGLLPEKVLSVTKDCLNAGMNIGVGVSLDGVGGHHDQIRGIINNFQRVDYLLGELLRLKDKKSYPGSLGVGLGYTLSPLTEEYFLEVQQYAKKLGIDFIPQVYEEFSYYSNEGQNKIEFSPKVYDMVKKMSPCFQKEVILSHLRKKPIQYRCCSMKKFFVLHCNGDISPCVKFAHVNAGNINKQPIREILNSPEFKKTLDVVENCRGCSNTWATRWNLRYWVFPFFWALTKGTVKRLLHI